MRMRVVFAGTPAFAIPCLNALLAADRAEVIAIYTQPDRRGRRGNQLCHSAVKQFARAHAPQTPPVLQPESFHSATAVRELQRLKPDLMVVVAYGLLLPRAVLAIPARGCINLHASLLPRWRGAAPIQRAIEAGDPVTGVSLMQMEARLDRGAVLARARLPIAAEDTSGSLHDKLAPLAAQLLRANLAALATQTLPAAAQDERQVCYAAKLQSAEAKLNWRLPAATLARQIRAFNPWPVARAELNGNALRVLRATADPTRAARQTRPGEIVRVHPCGLTVATGEGQLLLTEAQYPGGKPMPVSALLNGARNHPEKAIAPGMRFATES